MNKLLKIIFPIALLTILILVSGCFKKPVEPVNNIVYEDNNTVEEKATTTDIKLLDFYKTKLVDTSNWQVYKNEKYGFEMKYPRDWVIVDSPGLQPASFHLMFAKKSNVERVKEAG